jgi:tetratricopeptide (TPR) repeat protein
VAELGKKLVFTAVLLNSLTSVALSQDTSVLMQSDLCFETAHHLLVKNEFELASGAFKKCLEKWPTESRFYLGYGTANATLQNFKVAEHAYLQFAEIEPRSSEIWILLAVVYKMSDRIDDSIRALHNAIDRDGTSVSAWSKLGWTYYRAGRSSDAVRALTKWAELDPKSFEANYWLARAQQGVDNVKAEASVRMALAINSTSADALELLAQLSPTDQLGALGKITQLRPTCADAWRSLASAQAKAGQKRDAYTSAQEALHNRRGQPRDTYFDLVILANLADELGYRKDSKKYWKMASSMRELMPGFEKVPYSEDLSCKNQTKDVW